MMKWLIKNLAAILGIIIAVSTIAGFVVVYADVPKKLEAVATQQQVMQKSVADVSNSLKNYIDVQTAKEVKDAEIDRLKEVIRNLKAK